MSTWDEGDELDEGRRGDRPAGEVGGLVYVRVEHLPGRGGEHDPAGEESQGDCREEDEV